MKRFSLILFSLYMLFPLTAQQALYNGEGGKNHIIMFAESTLENGDFYKSDLFITDKIRANLISVLHKYGGFNCIDLNEAKNIIKVQKQLESSLYNESQTIEIGKLVKAKECVNIKTTRLPSGSYSINITLLNVETGEILGMFSSPKTYESAESYCLQAHYDCLSEILRKLRIKQTNAGINALKEEQRIAAEQAEKNKAIAKENARIEAEKSEQQRKEAEHRAKIAQEEQERKEAKEKAEAAEAKRELEAKKARELAEKKAKEDAADRAKAQNPFANETYYCEFENGSRFDSYKIEFTSQTECRVTITSVDSKGNENTVSKSGGYSFANNVLSVNVRIPNQAVKHVQKIAWKGTVAFNNGYNSFYMLIPTTSNDGAKKIRAEFHLQ